MLKVLYHYGISEFVDEPSSCNATGSGGTEEETQAVVLVKTENIVEINEDGKYSILLGLSGRWPLLQASGVFFIIILNPIVPKKTLELDLNPTDFQKNPDVFGQPHKRILSFLDFQRNNISYVMW